MRRFYKLNGKVLMLIILVICISIFLVPELFLKKYSFSEQIAELATLLSKKDIAELDKYFSVDTRFVYNGKTVDYNSARKNLLSAFDKDKVEFLPRSTEIDKIVSSDKDTIEIIIIGWPEVKNKSDKEINIYAKFKKINIFKREIIELKSNDDIFGYFFIDSNIDIK